MSTGGLRGASASISLSGIRPVLTWKSTAAAPTPMRLGPVSVPWAMYPWQLEQFCTNNCRPRLVSRWEAAGADAEAGLLWVVNAAYPTPTAMSPSSTTAYPATGRRRRAMIQLNGEPSSSGLCSCGWEVDRCSAEVFDAAVLSG